MSSCVSSRQGCGRHTVSLVVAACQARARRGDCTADESDMPHPREYDTSRKQRSTGADDPRKRLVRRPHTAGRGRGIIPGAILGTRATLHSEKKASPLCVRSGKEGTRVVDINTITLVLSHVSVHVVSLRAGAACRMQWQARARVTPLTCEPLCPCQRARRLRVVLRGAVSRQTDGQR